MESWLTESRAALGKSACDAVSHDSIDARYREKQRGSSERQDQSEIEPPRGQRRNEDLCERAELWRNIRIDAVDDFARRGNHAFWRQTGAHHDGEEIG